MIKKKEKEKRKSKRKEKEKGNEIRSRSFFAQLTCEL